MKNIATATVLEVDYSHGVITVVDSTEECFDITWTGFIDLHEGDEVQYDTTTNVLITKSIDTELLADCKANPDKYTTDNVVSLFRVKNVTETPKVDGFNAIVKKNMENQKRIQAERAKKNKSTLRSYRITRKG